MSEQGSPDDAEEALAHLRRKAAGLESASHLANELAALRVDRKRDEVTVGRQLALARSLRKAGRITAEEYVLYAGLPVERLHEERWINGEYDAELGPLDDQLKEIEKDYGLPEGHYWRKEDAPPEYQRITLKYEELLESRFIETLEEFGEIELAELRRQHPDDYDAMRESARQNVASERTFQRL